MSGNLPPGVTQRMIDEAAGGYDPWWHCAVCGYTMCEPCTRETCPNERPDEDDEP